MVAHNENPHMIVGDAKKEVIRKSIKVDAANVAGTDLVGFWRLRRCHENRLQFVVELIGELRPSYVFVVTHDPGDVRRDPGMKD